MQRTNLADSTMAPQNVSLVSTMKRNDSLQSLTANLSPNMEQKTDWTEGRNLKKD